MPDNLQSATDAVDRAWQAWKDARTPQSEAHYHEAYATWKAFGVRGVGRPVSGDAPMTSSERSQALRARQQQSASRWEKVAPIIQDLRRALERGDTPAVDQTARSLVKATEMLVSQLQVVHAQPDSDVVVLHGFEGTKLVLAFIPVVHLDDYFRRSHLSGKQANVVVDANLAAFARITTNKYERGEHRPYARSGSTFPRVDITLDDLETSGEQISDSVLTTLAGAAWVDQHGRAGRP
jgi:hypothetical protein